MKKALIVTVAAVLLVGSSALAYKAYARYDGWGHGRYHSRMTADDMSAFADARIAALKAGLKLNPDQEKLWAPIEGTLKELAAKRIERRAEMRSEYRDRAERDEQGDRPNPIERLRKGADRMSEAGADLKRLADAADPLYNSLDDAQKRRFDTLAQRGMHGMRGMRGEGRGWRRHGGFDHEPQGMGRHRYGDLGDEGRHPGMGHGKGPHMNPGMGPRGDDGHGHGRRQRTNLEYSAPAGAERL